MVLLPLWCQVWQTQASAGPRSLWLLVTPPHGLRDLSVSPVPLGSLGPPWLLSFSTLGEFLKINFPGLEQPMAAWRRHTIYFPTYVGTLRGWG